MRGGPEAVRLERGVLLAGATGVLGRQVFELLRARGIRVRAMGRNAAALGQLGADECVVADLLEAKTVRGCAGRVDAVISCAGAPLALNWRDGAGFHRVDYLGHLPLIEDAVRHRVSKFVYVSLAGAMALRQTEYAQAHERTVATLAGSGLRYTIVRPAGLFHSFREFLKMARMGLMVLPGNGGARMNPIHECDAARACVEALWQDETQLIVGGPEVFTRRRIAEMAFESQGMRPRVIGAPRGLFAPVVAGMGLFNRRLAAIVEFSIAVSQVDCIAPMYGERRLGEYLRAAARRSGGGER